METRNYISKDIVNISKANGSLNKNYSEILMEMRLFYVLSFSDIPKLTEEEKNSLEGLFTESEVLACLNR